MVIGKGAEAIGFENQAGAGLNPVSPAFAGSSRVSPDQADAVVYGIPTDCGAGSHRLGASSGPSEIRRASTIWNSVRTSQGYPFPEHGRLLDLGDLAIDHLPREQVFEQLGAMIPDYSPSRLTLMLGGDHSVTLPVLERLKRAWGMVYFDAHPDAIESLKGSRYSHASTLKHLIESGLAIAERTVLIGIRAPEAEEIDFIRRHKLQVYTAFDVLEMGIAEVIKRTLERVAGVPLYLSIDMDALDASCVPGVENPEPGGLSTRELLYACARLAPHVEACDIVEVTDQCDPAKITATAAARIGLDLIGNYIAHKRGG